MCQIATITMNRVVLGITTFDSKWGDNTNDTHPMIERVKRNQERLRAAGLKVYSRVRYFDR